MSSMYFFYKGENRDEKETKKKGIKNVLYVCSIIGNHAVSSGIMLLTST
jgi:hypothetical protein